MPSPPPHKPRPNDGLDFLRVILWAAIVGTLAWLIGIAVVIRSSFIN